MELLSPSSKNKRNYSEKKVLYFRKWNFLTLRLKDVLIFSKESFSYISGNRTMDFSAQAQKINKICPRKMELFYSNIKKFVIFQETGTPKKFIIFSQKKASLIFQKTEILKKLFILQETELSYISGNGNPK